MRKFFFFLCYLFSYWLFISCYSRMIFLYSILDDLILKFEDGEINLIYDLDSLGLKTISVTYTSLLVVINSAIQKH